MYKVEVEEEDTEELLIGRYVGRNNKLGKNHGNWEFYIES